MYSKFVLFIAVHTIFSCINGFSQSNKNFLIVENPFELKIYNKYEQTLSSSESSYFLPYCPIEIIIEDTLLSDRYTSAFIGKIDNQLFYFIKSERNLSFNKIFNSYSTYIKNVKSIMDTIQIAVDNTIVFYNAKDNNQKERLVLNTKLLRIFRKGPATYVKNLSSPVKYGWCDLRNTETWNNYQSLKTEKVIDIAEIETVIKEKLTNTNNIIQKIFNHFNTLNRNNIPIPYWTYSNNGNDMTCLMLNNDRNYDFTESTNILINELQLALAYTNYSVLWQSHKIIIRKSR